MMHDNAAQALAQARAAELRDQARRDGLARTARQARRVRRQPATRRTRDFLAVFTRQARLRDAPESR